MPHPEGLSPIQQDPNPKLLELRSRFHFFDQWIDNGALPVDMSLDPIPGRQAGKDFMMAWAETFKHGDIKLLGKDYVTAVRKEIERLHRVMPRAAEEVVNELIEKRKAEYEQRMIDEGRVNIHGRWVKQKPKKS